MRLHRTEQPERFCSGCLLHLGLTYIPRCALRDFRSERTSRTFGTGESDLNLLKWLNRYFTKTEKLLWSGSVLLILCMFLLFDRENYLTLAASLIGVTSLIFMAKAHPFGQLLVILFSLLYGIISYSFAYYGEMLTYLGMTMPMAAFALVSWLRNPYQGNHAEVQVNHLRRWEYLLMAVLVGAVTVIFYFVLAYFHTANLIPSTVSVATSFGAAYLTFRRNPWYAAWYAANDLVLIVLWILAAMVDSMYLSVAVCFVAFLANDLYGFINWRRIASRQSAQADCGKGEM